ncbi:MAG: winged helix-turn-helix domain-containing protein, partial [Evtepia sp.]
MDTLTFTLKPESHIPLYRQLYEWIKTEIQAQRILPGEKLPSKRKLAIHLNISQNTIQTAYYQLVEEGYLTSVEKSGFYVSQIENMVALEDHMERNTSPVKTTHSTVNSV